MTDIYVIGIGPGGVDTMTADALRIMDECDVIAGYKTYIDLIRMTYPDKEYYTNGMRGEKERCLRCVEYMREGKTVALICSGDPGVYGMASPMLETAYSEGIDTGRIHIIPGVSAALGGAALLGAPINHDFCVVSLSDLLTPWEIIEKRLICAAQGDYVIVIYNPSSKNRPMHLKNACDVLMRYLPDDTACGYVRCISREGEEYGVCTLEALTGIETDMFTTVYIGNSMTYIKDGRLITPRGYDNE